MGTKDNPGKFDCYGNALPDEPMFVLLGRDPDAPNMVDQWANRRSRDIDRGIRPEEDRELVKEAGRCADGMRAWRDQNFARWREEKCPPVLERAVRAPTMGEGLRIVMTALGIVSGDLAGRVFNAGDADEWCLPGEAGRLRRRSILKRWLGYEVEAIG